MKITPRIIAEAVFHLYRTEKNGEERLAVLRVIASFIARKELQHLLPKIGIELDRLEKKTADIVAAEAVTAFPLSDVEHGKIKKFITGELKIEAEKLEMTFSEDKSILGGFIVKTEDALIDRSIGGRLTELARGLQA